MTTTLWDRVSETTADVPKRPRWRRWALLGAAVVAVLVVMGVFVGTGPKAATTTPMDPDNPTATGAQALARVLDQQGVRVQVARGETELARADVDSDTTVLVTRPSDLAPSTTRSMAGYTVGAERLVLLGAESSVTRYLTAGTSAVSQRRSGDDLVATGCDTPDVRQGEALSRSQLEYQSAAATGTCFTHDGRSVYLSVPRTPTAPALVLLGSTSIATNDQVTDASNAAVLLRTLGHSPRLVWYVPSRADVPASDSSPSALLPRWLGPGLLLAGIAFLGVVLWRGRRLGRLVPEPLPVVVRAVETTQSRGRLYRRARDAGRAASVLQHATRDRLAAYLGMPVPPSPGPQHRGGEETMVRAVSLASGRPPDEVGALLFGPPPTTDDHLLGLAAELAALEKEVRRS